MTSLIEYFHGARHAEFLREACEADEIAEQNGGIGHGVGDARARGLFQAVDDRFGQNVGEQAVGFGPGAIRLGQGVTHDERDDAECRDGRGDIEIMQQADVRRDTGAAGWVEKPSGQMECEPGQDSGDDEPDMP